MHDKVVLMVKHQFTEIVLRPEMCIGTGVHCQVRLQRDHFFDAFQVQFVKQTDGWCLVCGETVYVTVGGVKKKEIYLSRHGQECVVKYERFNLEVCRIMFMPQVPDRVPEYNAYISVDSQDVWVIGDTVQADVRIERIDQCLKLMKVNGDWVLQEMCQQDTVIVNNQLVTLPYMLKDKDFFRMQHISFYFNAQRLYFDNHICQCVSSALMKEVHTVMFQAPIWVHQAPRYAPVYEMENVFVSVSYPNKEPFDVYRLTSLLPLSIAFGVTLFLGNSMTGSGYPILMMGVTFAGGVLQSGLMYAQHKRRYTQAKSEYTQALIEAEMTMKTLQDKELRHRERMYAMMLPWENQQRVFDRRSIDEDFLHVYLGRGTIKSKHHFDNHHEKTRDVLLLQQEYEWLKDVPVTIALQEKKYIGVVGAREDTDRLVKQMLLDIALRHQPSDVRCFVLSDGKTDVSWARWLPHVQDQDMMTRFISDVPKKGSILLDAVHHLTEKIVVFIWGREQLASHPVFEQLDHLAHVFLIVIEETVHALPAVCTHVIRIQQETGDVLNVQQDYIESAFHCRFLSQQDFFNAVCMIGNTRMRTIDNHKRMPAEVGLYTLLGVFALEDLDMLERWQKHRCPSRLTVPIGQVGVGELLYLDVSDDQHGHGPHGLIAGTTGSGKSECIQTYIAMMMATYHPHDVTFLLIDFKGGGMSRIFTGMPHVVGTLTNLDAHEMSRSLQFIKAEVTKRQQCFLDKGVSHITAYQQCIANGEEGETLAHLIIVIDEFAELKMAYPEWMKELVSIARIGRTLGIHLILATQKPSGVVDAQIWSNARFKICLKVQTKEDSHDMIKTDLAVFLKEPGRAYLQIGHEPVVLFQSGYGGARVPTHAQERTYKVYERPIGGVSICVYETASTEDEDTQMYRLLSVLQQSVTKAGITPLSSVLLPPLPTDIASEDVGTLEQLCIGLCDKPSEQRQERCSINGKQHLLVTGATQTGKTTTLETVLCGLLRQEAPVFVYVIDCAQEYFKWYTQHGYVGDVIGRDDTEKYRCFCVFIARIIKERRQQKHDERGKEWPQIVIIIDQLSAFLECYPESTGFLERLLRDGERVGVTCVISAEHAQTVPYRLQLCIRQRICLYSTDKHDYQTLVGTTQLLPNVPGRCWVRQDEQVYACQIARMSERSIACDKRHVAPPIPMVPAVLMGQDVPYQPEQIALGLDYDSVTVTYMPFTDKPLLVVGRPPVRLMYILSLLQWMQLHQMFSSEDVYIIDHPSKSLQMYAQDHGISQYCCGDAAMTSIETWCAVIKGSCQPTLVIVNDQQMLIHSEKLKELVEYAQDTEVMVIIGDVVNEPVTFTSSAHMTWLKMMTRGILCDDIAFNRFFDNVGSIPKHKHEKGMVYDMSDMTVRRLKMYVFERG